MLDWLVGVFSCGDFHTPLLHKNLKDFVELRNNTEAAEATLAGPATTRDQILLADEAARSRDHRAAQAKFAAQIATTTQALRPEEVHQLQQSALHDAKEHSLAALVSIEDAESALGFPHAELDIARECLQYMTLTNGALAHLHMQYLDGSGHSNGWTPDCCEAVRKATRLVGETVMHMCRAHCGIDDRASFIALAKAAYGANGVDLTTDQLAKLLLTYHWDQEKNNRPGFLSNAKISALTSIHKNRGLGPRARRGTKSKGESIAAEDSTACPASVCTAAGLTASPAWECAATEQTSDVGRRTLPPSLVGVHPLNRGPLVPMGDTGLFIDPGPGVHGTNWPQSQWDMIQEGLIAYEAWKNQSNEQAGFSQ